MLPQRTNNPLAPAHLNGLSSIGVGYEDKLFCRSFAVDLPVDANLLNLQVPLDKDADIFLVALSLQNGAGFAFRLHDSTGYFVSDAYMDATVVYANQGIGVPYVFSPAFWLPAGSNILIDLQDQLGAGEAGITFLFWYLKRYKN